MNAATQAIKDATFDMRDYALYSTILVGLGTFLAFAAFVLSLLANRSAREAVRVMREEQRPWVTVDFMSRCQFFDESDGREGSICVSMVEKRVQNRGKSNAWNLVEVFKFAKGGDDQVNTAVSEVELQIRGRMKPAPIGPYLMPEQIKKSSCGAYSVTGLPAFEGNGEYYFIYGVGYRYEGGHIGLDIATYMIAEVGGGTFDLRESEYVRRVK